MSSEEPTVKRVSLVMDGGPERPAIRSAQMCGAGRSPPRCPGSRIWTMGESNSRLSDANRLHCHYANGPYATAEDPRFLKCFKSLSMADRFFHDFICFSRFLASTLFLKFS